MKRALTAPRKRVLIIDDDPAIREMLCAVLHGEGYDTDTANDGLEGLEKATATHPDVVLLDYAMPRCNGAGFAARYRLRPEHAPIILLTASFNLLERCSEVHADGCLGKPFELDELLDAVALHGEAHALAAAA